MATKKANEVTAMIKKLEKQLTDVSGELKKFKKLADDTIEKARAAGEEIIMPEHKEALKKAAETFKTVQAEAKDTFGSVIEKGMKDTVKIWDKIKKDLKEVKKEVKVAAQKKEEKKEVKKEAAKEDCKGKPCKAPKKAAPKAKAPAKKPVKK